MRGKWLIAGIAIILGILSVRQLSYTWYTNKVESEARMLAQNEQDEQLVLDSLANDTLNILGMKYNYRDAKNKEIKLGLDLKGGISVILEVQVRDLLENLADHSKNPIFVEALDAADITQRSQGNRAYVDIFFEEFERIRQEKGQTNLNYSSPEIFGNRQNAAFIDFNSSDNEVKRLIKEDIDAKIGTAFQVISSRINRFGVVEPIIQRLGGSADGRILVEMPGERNRERIKNLLQSTANLEFWKVEANNPQVINYFTTVNPKNLGIDTEYESLNEFIQQPFEGNSLFSVMLKDTAIFNQVLNSKEFRASLPGGIRNFNYYWANKPVEIRNPEVDGRYISLYALSGTQNGEPLLPGDVIDRATGERNMSSITNEPVVSMRMNAEGAQRWAKITEENVGNSIAIVLDNLVFSAPNINEKISGGNSQISGNFTLSEAQDLANILQAGSLPASSKIVQLEEVGPSLGQEAIDSSLISFMVVFGLILVWMIFYYSRAGFYADIALTANILFLLGLLVGLFDATLSLPGIAGIILTLGMAIDANILINERVKDEMFQGKSVKEAVRIAYTWKGAISAIVDTNVTSMLTAVILLFIGKGPVQGFAITLLIGLSVSMFTAIFLTKFFTESRFEKKKDVQFYTSITKNWFQGINFDFMSKRKTFYTISTVISILAIVIIFVRGFDLGVDFQGGRTYTVRFDQPITAGEVREALESTLIDEDGSSASPTVKIFGPSNQVKITTKVFANVEGTDVDEQIVQMVYDGVKSFYANEVSFDEFSDDATEIGLLSVVKVGPTIASDTTRASIIAIVLALLVVGFYILVRFKWQFGVGLVVAAVHDVIIIFGLFAALHGILPFNLEIDQAFIAAILTAIGYSINDSVIIFDRIREYLGLYPRMNFSDLINKATNSTLPRTMNTSLSMLLVVLIIFIFGGETIKGFMFTMMIGVVVGTYSSIFIASQIMYDLTKKSESKKVE